MDYFKRHMPQEQRRGSHIDYGQYLTDRITNAFNKQMIDAEAHVQYMIDPSDTGQSVMLFESNNPAAHRDYLEDLMAVAWRTFFKSTPKERKKLMDREAAINHENQNSIYGLDSLHCGSIEWTSDMPDMAGRTLPSLIHDIRYYVTQHPDSADLENDVSLQVDYAVFNVETKTMNKNSVSVPLDPSTV